jgi:pyrimidine-specific ribonucleoside hydrolase
MDLVIETDIGHDPDDFFAICYLIAAGVRVRAISVVPGDPDQIAIARLLCERTGLDIPVAASKLGRTKLSSGSLHHELLHRYGKPLSQSPDGLGKDILPGVISASPDCELFVIGPASSLGAYMAAHPQTHFRRATMQGGFLPYSLHQPSRPHEDFVGKTSMPTFNLNGDRRGGLEFLSGNVAERRLVGKNVCHTVLFTREVFAACRPQSAKDPAAADLFVEAAEMYFRQHDVKKFHDPTAAACHLHPEIGTWFRGKTVKEQDGWTTVPDPAADYVLADVDYERLWDCILNFRGPRE